MSVVAVIAGYLLALDVSGVIEARNLDIGAGGYVGISARRPSRSARSWQSHRRLPRPRPRHVPCRTWSLRLPHVACRTRSSRMRHVARDVIATDAQPAPKTTGPPARIPTRCLEPNLDRGKTNDPAAIASIFSLLLSFLLLPLTVCVYYRLVKSELVVAVRERIAAYVFIDRQPMRSANALHRSSMCMREERIRAGGYH
ncbi:MAG TPA: hypothetical protein VF526_22185 [Solirubrobacteraceae bacterium]